MQEPGPAATSGEERRAPSAPQHGAPRRVTAQKPVDADAVVPPNRDLLCTICGLPSCWQDKKA